VVFNGSVSGLSNGANVLFNGIKVGEVTHLTFSRSDPHTVVADIDVSSDAPIDRNTKARLETQGLTGAGVVALLGGSTPGQPLVGDNGQPAVIYAVQSMQLQEILDNVGALSIRATAVLDDADKIITDNSGPIHSAIGNLDVFSKALADNAPGVDAALKSVGEIGKQIGPLAARLQTLSDDADRLVQSIDTDKVRAVVDNVQTFSQALSASSDNVRVLARDGAALATHLNDSAKRLDTALIDVDQFMKAIDSQKIASIVDSVNDVVATVRQNRANVDITLKNFGELSGKLNNSADKVDGLIASAQSFLGSPGTKGALEKVGDAAQSVKKLADDVDVRVKDIAGGLS